MKEKILEIIAAEYGPVEPVVKFETAPGHSLNSKNYIVTFSGGQRLLCKYLKGIQTKRVLKLLEITEFCEKKGALIPGIIRTKKGGILNKVGGGAFYLMQFLEGGRFNGSGGELADLGKELAVLHGRLKECPVEYVSDYQSGQYRHLSESELEKIADGISESGKISDFDKEILADLDAMKEHYRRNKNKAGGINKDKIPVQYIHGDLHPGNVLFSNAKVSGFLDFNALRTGERIRDVAFACYRFSLYNTADKMEIRKRKGLFLNSYLKTNRLTGEEQKNMDYYFVNECLNRISYILRGHYHNDDPSWNFDLKKHLNNINTVEMMSE